MNALAGCRMNSKFFIFEFLVHSTASVCLFAVISLVSVSNPYLNASVYLLQPSKISFWTCHALSFASGTQYKNI